MREESDALRMGIFADYVQTYGAGGTKKVDLSKGISREWTPIRHCCQDWILAATVSRCTRERYEVALFLAEEHFLFEREAGLKAGLCFLLADALYRTGRMELIFCGPRSEESRTLESGHESQVPRQIIRLAKRLGVEVRAERKLTDHQGRQLYCRLSGLDSDLLAELDARGLDSVQAAFLAHRGVWSPTALALIAQKSVDPAALILGSIRPENWLEFKHGLLLLRQAIMAERVLTLFELAGDSHKDVVSCRPGYDGLELRALEPVTVSCLYGRSLTLRPKECVSLRLIPRDQDEFPLFAESDFKGRGEINPVVAAVTKDFDWTEASVHTAAKAAADRGELFLVQVADTVNELDSEAFAKLSRAATTQISVEEQGE